MFVCHLISDDTPQQLSDQAILQPTANSQQPPHFTAPPYRLSISHLHHHNHQPFNPPKHKSQEHRAQSTRSLTQIITASTLKPTIKRLSRLPSPIIIIIVQIFKGPTKI
jgi:hypothetical protein